MLRWNERGELTERGVIEEARLLRDDIARASARWLVNSVRRWRLAQLVR